MSRDDLATAEHRPIPPLPPVAYRRYLDADFYALELDHVFRKSWFVAGHMCEYPETGSYRLLDIPFAPVLVVRGKDGVLRAFLNSCQHRGSTVLREKQGCTARMTCQYHGWNYDLTGRLVGVTSPEAFPGLDKSALGLPPVRCESWGGFIFVNLDPDAPPLLDWLAPATRARFSSVVPIDPDRPMREIYRQSWEVDCNWKAMVENFWESYHFAFIHGPTVATLIDDKRTELRLFPDGHGAVITPYRQKTASDEQWKGVMNSEDSQGTPIPGMTAEFVADLNRANEANMIFPGTLFNVATSGFVYVQQWPLSVDRCRLDVTMFVEDWGEGPAPAALQAVADVQAEVALEDMSCMSSIQQSLRSNPDNVVRLGAREVLLYHLHAQIDRCIGDAVPPLLRVPDVLADFVERDATTIPVAA